MIASYTLRLVCLSFAVFLVVHTALGSVVVLLAPAAVRAADRIRPRLAARLLLGLRLLPAATAIFVVAVFCIPSYLWLEQSAAEEVGWTCLAAALVAAAMCGGSALGAMGALMRSTNYARNCRRVADMHRFEGEALPVWVVKGTAPLMALAGVLRPHLVVSGAVVTALSPEQLAAALRHEDAHRRARDNFKRLLLAASPGLLPRVHAFGALEREWARMSEWAADDESVQGDPLRSLSLADALVRVARLGSPARTTALEVSFCGDGSDLVCRVNRLLHPRTFAPVPARRTRVLAAVAAIAVMASVAGLTLQAQTLSSAHRLLEYLVH
jgi:hypothetical protein